MPIILKISFLLILSNAIMTFAKYAHLKNLNGKTCGYLLQVPESKLRTSSTESIGAYNTSGSNRFTRFCHIFSFLHGGIHKTELCAGCSILGAVYFIFKA